MPSLVPLRTAILLVFCSGFAALVFQVAWMRELRLVFGATTAAVAAVLAIFMGGLCIGSALLSKFADRAPRPLLFYGALEIGIAMSAAASPWLIRLAMAIYIHLGGQQSLGLVGATVVRLLLTAAVLAVPSFLMGGTLPAATRAATSKSDDHRRALAILYGANTLGAVLGGAFATLFALENLGTRATLYLGCAAGLAAGAIAVAIARQLAPFDVAHDIARNPTKADAASDAPRSSSKSHPALLYTTAAILGFAFFALELVWYRMLGPILGGTAFTFGLILCFALLGIGVGGIIYYFLFRRISPSWSALAITCGLEALFVILPFALGDRLAIWAAAGYQRAESFPALVLSWSVIISIVVLPAALVSGVQFPLLTALLGHGRESVGKHVGRAYAWNTFGAIAGSLVAGFGAMPLLSATGLWQALAGLLTILSLSYLIVAPNMAPRARLFVSALAIATFASTMATGPTAAWRHGGVGGGRADVIVTSPNSVQRWINDKRHCVEWQADGIESSVGIDGQDGWAFIVGGKSDGNSLGDAPTQMGAAIIGGALHPDPKSALVIGLGTGESAGWLADMRGIKRVDVVELERAIDEVALRCKELNRDVLHHPHVRRIYCDGREFVFTTPEKYDVIFSEPSNPYRAGVAALYTTEFYDAARQRLNPGGIFIQWLQAYEIDVTTVPAVVATAHTAFRHIEIWQTCSSDLQLVCSDSPITYSTDDIHTRINTPILKEALLKAWKADSVESFMSHFVANAGYADAVSRTPFMLLNTDDRTILEFTFAKMAGRMTPFSVEVLRDQLSESGYHRPPITGSIDWTQTEIRRQLDNLLSYGQLSAALLPKEEEQALMESLTRYQAERFAAALETWPAPYLQPTDPVLQLVLARIYAELGRRECLELIAKTEAQFPTDSASLKTIYYSHTGDHLAAADAMTKLCTLLATDPWISPVISDAAFDRAAKSAAANTEAAKRMYPLLSRPFASRRSNYRRQFARVKIGAVLGPEIVAEALTELEPHIPWRAEILKPRAAAYAATYHPLADQAEHDWQRFHENARRYSADERAIENASTLPAE